jgi:hypothetical protein
MEKVYYLVRQDSTSTIPICPEVSHAVRKYDFIVEITFKGEIQYWYIRFDSTVAHRIDPVSLFMEEVNAQWEEVNAQWAEKTIALARLNYDLYLDLMKGYDAQEEIGVLKTRIAELEKETGAVWKRKVDEEISSLDKRGLEALNLAAQYRYFDDRSDYGNALNQIIRSLLGFCFDCKETDNIDPHELYRYIYYKLSPEK